MGLDSFIRKDVAYKPEETQAVELWYGRKENEIHGWMQRQSGIPAEEFNCARLYLTIGLLDQLAADAKANKLTATEGFYFGNPNEAEDLMIIVDELIKVSRMSLAIGEKPYYWSWW